MAVPDAVTSDAVLVAAAREGDREAFAVLVERHRTTALALVTRLLGGTEGAADAVQEAAVMALVGLDRLRSPDRFGAWFCGIALNVARRWVRRAGTVRRVGVTAGDAEPDPFERAVAAELARRVRQAVAGLAPGQREAVLAFYWKGLSHAEAAAELGVSPAALKARLHQARDVLGRRLGAEAPARRGARKEQTVTEGQGGSWIEAEVADVRRSGGEDPLRRYHAVVLAERAGSRRVPIFVGAPEATALALSLEAVEMPRPMTYAMAAQLTAAAGARVVDVRITNLTEHVVHAVVRIDGPAGPAELDARPSDALNLAVVCGAPVLVDAAVFSALGGPSGHDWQRYPTGTRELATETVVLTGEIMAAALAASRREGCTGEL